MAGGWARDGAVNEQIEASIADELARMRAEREALRGESLEVCEECGEPIPLARRKAVPGVRLCVSCQQSRDGSFRSRAGFNRRGSKDSQMK
ncbi:DksA/TraR family C4-type zinc finger protein [Paracoccus aminophilus]|uniref:C4-type zinc finger protein, DksA/TraR family n=1 Tax=Paracoccus aminophilus JCM 7686 TaxID=1367847 RepID=S5Y9Z2_PARAH|nr:DksA/TraR family C4-type zinc finger protein [Paracoccus aminophilus]AGT08203.1 C4-type zinc finger protein, DksA/TraR family [Paracoccus aminophilus JCM 7686]